MLNQLLPLSTVIETKILFHCPIRPVPLFIVHIVYIDEKWVLGGIGGRKELEDVPSKPSKQWVY